MTSFRLFGPDHLAVMAVTLLGVAGVVGWAGCRQNTDLRQDNDQTWRRTAAALLAVNEGAAWLIALLQGKARVPLQLCDIALVLAVWALWSPRPVVATLVYYWALMGSLQAILTPDLAYGFPDYWFIKFFITHSGTLLAGLYLAKTGRVAREAYWPVRVWLITTAYAAIALTLNLVFGTNYGYLRAKPIQPSLLDYFGPWPVYLLVMECVAMVCLWLCYRLLTSMLKQRPIRTPSNSR